MSALSFEIEKQDKESRARVGLIRTRRGDIETPYLVPVATLGSVRALGSETWQPWALCAHWPIHITCTSSPEMS